MRNAEESCNGAPGCTLHAMIWLCAIPDPNPRTLSNLYTKMRARTKHAINGASLADGAPPTNLCTSENRASSTNIV